MTFKQHPARPGPLALVLVVAALVGCGPSVAEVATKDMQKLQRTAAAELKKGRAQQARKQLLEAVRVGKEGGVDDAPVMAEAHAALGAVYAIQKDADKAASHMAEALERDPAVKLRGAFAAPAARKALGAARADAKKAKAKPKAEPDEAPARAKEPVEVAAAPPPPPPPPPAPVEAAPRPRAVETAAPTGGSEPLTCKVPDEAPPENEVMFRCAVRADVRVPRLSLHYRPSGSETFTEIAMPRNKRGWYTGVVPAAATTGKLLQYFVEARGPNKLTSGSSESPNLILIREGAPPAGRGDPVPGSGGARDDDDDDDRPSQRNNENEDPLQAIAKAREEERESTGRHRRGAGAVLVGLGLGSGYGWQPGGQLEFRKDKEVGAGPLAGGTLHVLPELGYQVNDDFAVSAQLRFQYIPSEGAGDPNPGAPIEKAYAVLLRAAYAAGAGNLRGVVSGYLGGGDGFRLRVPRDPKESLVRSDTVRGGPLVAGAGAGFAYHFNTHLAWTADLRALLGVPKLALVAELNTGFEAAF